MCALVLPTSGHAITLKEAIQRAVTEHPQIGIAVRNSNAAVERLRQARAGYAPTFDLDGDVGQQIVNQPETSSTQDNNVWRTRRQVSLSGKLVLFNGFQRANNVYQSEARLDAAAMSVMENAEAVALQVVEAYVDHRRHTQLLHIAHQNVRRHYELLELARGLVQDGEATRSLIFQVEERLYGAQVTRAEVLESLLEANAKFRGLVGVEPQSTLPIRYPLGLPQSAHAALKVALRHNPTIGARRLEAEALSFDRERIRGEFFPTLSLEGSSQFGADIDGDPGRNDDHSVRLRLSWNLYDGGVRKARMKEASELKNAAILQRDLAVRRIRQEIETAYGRLRALDQRLAASNQRVAATQSILTSLDAEFEADRVTLLDLVDAERAVAASRFEQASVSGIRLFAAYTVRAFTGTLLSSFGIEPEITRPEPPRFIGVPKQRPTEFAIEPLD